jgi:hypothetical protein
MKAARSLALMWSAPRRYMAAAWMAFPLLRHQSLEDVARTAAISMLLTLVSTLLLAAAKMVSLLPRDLQVAGVLIASTRVVR